jgi:hypothetical protein
MKELNERAIGDKFIAACNSRHGTNFAYKGRPTEAPDLTYVDGAAELNVEVGTAYYDDADAVLQWKAARGSPNAPRVWCGINFENGMVENINAIIAGKCQGTDYGPRCVLLVRVRPKLTTIADMRKLLNDIKLPSRTPFDGIYVSGDFPDSSDSPGGYSCWRIHAPRGGGPQDPERW